MSITIGDLEAGMKRLDKMKPFKSQVTLAGDTTKWIIPERVYSFNRSYFYRVLTQHGGGAVMSQFNTAAAAEFPISVSATPTELSVLHSDLRTMQATATWNSREQDRTMDKGTAVRNAVMGQRNDIVNDFTELTSQAIHQGGDSRQATVSEMYDEDGSAWSGSAGSAAAYINIKDGSINKFHVNDVLQISEPAGTRLITMVVLDVHYGADGPMSAGTAVQGIGPGITCTPSDDDGTPNATTWDAVSAPAADDVIARLEMYQPAAANFTGINGFDALFDTEQKIFRNAAGTLLDREATGNSWMNPMIVNAQVASVDQQFDSDTHLSALRNVTYKRVESGRKTRKGTVYGVTNQMVTKRPMVMFGQPELVEAAQADAADSLRFTTSSALTMDAARKKEIFGAVGFEGIVYHDVLGPPLALQADLLCTPGVLRCVDPSSLFWMKTENGESGQELRWIELSEGSKYVNVPGANGRPTYVFNAVADMDMYLGCDQPGINAEIRGLTT